MIATKIKNNNTAICSSIERATQALKALLPRCVPDLKRYPEALRQLNNFFDEISSYGWLRGALKVLVFIILNNGGFADPRVTNQHHLKKTAVRLARFGWLVRHSWPEWSLYGGWGVVGLRWIAGIRDRNVGLSVQVKALVQICFGILRWEAVHAILLLLPLALHPCFDVVFVVVPNILLMKLYFPQLVVICYCLSRHLIPLKIYPSFLCFF